MPEVVVDEDTEASVVSGSAEVEEKTLVVDSWIDVFCDQTQRWYPARIVRDDDKEGRVLVQFFNWSDRHNQWVSKVRPAIKVV